MTSIKEYKKCLVCGDIFYKKNVESRRYWKTKKYCSPKCSLTLTSIKNSPKKSLGFPKGLIPWNKDKKGLMPTPWNKGKKTGLAPWRGKERLDIRGKNSSCWKPKVTRLCPTCGIEMQLAPWESKRKFCSLECRGLGKRGKNSPVYKGENSATKFRSRVMQLPEYIEWRKIIMKRDNWTCQGCQKRGGDMEVDHIKPFKDIICGYTIENVRECVELWDTMNGRTLCRECHRKTDTYGNRRTKLTS